MISDLASYIDHSFLKPVATNADIVRICEEAMTYSFASVCIPPYYVPHARNVLSPEDTKICTVIGFPFGYSLPAAKYKEAKLAEVNGADEFDMVINQCAVKNGDFEYVLNEIRTIKRAFPLNVLKVIVETCNLSHSEKVQIVQVVIDSGADYIKTSTGFGSAGANLEDIKLFKELAGDRLKIKASGGIKDAQTAMAFIEAGASRIGTSYGVAIIKEGV